MNLFGTFEFISAASKVDINALAALFADPAVLERGDAKGPRTTIRLILLFGGMGKNSHISPSRSFGLF